MIFCAPRIVIYDRLSVAFFQENFPHRFRYPVVFGDRKFFEVFVDEEVVVDSGSFARLESARNPFFRARILSCQFAGLRPEPAFDGLIVV